MDGVSALVVIIFVFSIFSSLGNQGYTPPKTTIEQLPRQEMQLTQTVSPDYDEGLSGGHWPAINQFVSRYREKNQAQEIASAIVKQAKQFNVNPKLVSALMARESRFNPGSVSSSGAVGLGQLLPSTCKTVGIDDPYDIDQNAKGTVKYLRYLLDKFSGRADRLALALGGYLEGPNAMVDHGLSNNHTRSYVKDIFDLSAQI